LSSMRLILPNPESLPSVRASIIMGLKNFIFKLGRSFHGIKPESASHNFDLNFIFCHGNLEPRKNHLSLIRGYSLALKKNKNLPRLIIAGHKAWGTAEISSEIEKLDLQDKVTLTGYISQNQLVRFIEECIIYITCSLYEGWGFPLFEALEKAKPAIYHHKTSQVEFAEEFAVGIDCSRPDNIAIAITDLLESDEKRTAITEKLKAEFNIPQYNLTEKLKEIFINQKLIT